MTDLLERVVLPVADPDDAAASAEALAANEFGSVLVVHVVEKAGGAVDKASVEQREQRAEEMFEAARQRLTDARIETEVAYGTDVAETVFDVADDHDATAIVITPRGGSRWVRLLTGDVALSLVTETDRPVVVLPDDEATDADSPPGAGNTGETDWEESGSE